MRTHLRFSLALLIALVAHGPSPRLSAQAGGFQIDTQYVTGLSAPTALAFLPDGRMFVTQQSGAIRVVLANQQVLATPFMTVNVRSDGERGLLGIALDPQFATNNFVYIFYSPGDAAVSRLSRVTANGNVVVPGSEVTLFEYGNISGNHRGGDLRFGPDGYLYVALGDAGDSANSQSVTTFDGKILRLNKADGSAAPGNPATFRTTSGTTVTPTGGFTRIWAMGLRNPYRFSFHPTTGAMRINDVGSDRFEEVNPGQAGANYGWPTCEGLCSNSFATNPIYTHVRDVSNPDGGCAITGGAFQSGGQFPAQYADDYFVIDYCMSWVHHVRVDDSWGTIPVSVPIGSTDLRFAPDGSLLVIGNSTGTIARITSTGGGNRNPVAQGTATPTSGTAPLTVAFSAAGSSDPDGDPLTYAWSFGDGGSASGASTSRVYTNDGPYTATLTVSDGRGGSAARTFAIAVGLPPTPTFTQPASGTLYSAGDTISFAGTATDPTDGTLPASAFSWTVLYHHDSHTHPVLGPLNDVRSGSFTIPRTGHPEHTVFYRIYLTVRDSSGLQTQITRDVTPRKTNVTLATNVAGAQVLLDGQPQTAPYTFTSVVGVQRTIEVPSPQTIGGRTYVFSGWSDGGARSHGITAPLANQTFTATLTEAPVSGPPQALTGAVARTAVTLSWARPVIQPQLVTGYIVEAGLSPGETQVVLPVGNVLGFSTGAASGRYYVRVRATAAGGESAASNEVVIDTGQAAPPLAPQALLATVVGTNVLFEWRENPLGPEIAQYVLLAGSTSGSSNLAVVPLPAASRSFLASAPAGRYYVRMAAMNAAGVGAASNEAVVTLGAGVCTVPSVPTGLVATPQAGAVSLQWNAASSGAGLTGYRLEAGTVRGASNIATLHLPLTTAIGGAVPRGTYFVRLAATNSCGSSATTADITFVVP